MKNNFDKPASLALAAALATWSIGPVLIRYMVDYFDAYSQNFYRYVVGALFWLPFLLYYVLKKKMDHRIWLLAIVPALINCYMQTFWASSMYHINAGFSTLLSKSQIIWTSLLVLAFVPDERYLYKRKIFWFGLIIAICGLLGVVLSSENFRLAGTVKGIIFVTLSAFGWSSYTVYFKKYLNDIDPRKAFAVISIYTLLLLGILAVLFGKPLEGLPTTSKPWLAIVISGVTGIAFGHVLYMYAIKRVGAVIPIVVILFQPFTVLIVSSIMLKEVISLSQFVFGCILIGGGIIASLARAGKVDSELVK